MPAGSLKLSPQHLEVIAWDFLASEFTGQIYADWTIDQRVDAYLHHHGRDDLMYDGAAYDALLQRVMDNVGQALRRGILTTPRA